MIVLKAKIDEKNKNKIVINSKDLAEKLNDKYMDSRAIGVLEFIEELEITEFVIERDEVNGLH
jgi:hypothetical protein|nr:MAG TPA: hypothetical protein [Caudoviricetes sp.]DAT16332.1 MAG TPA: hypothetical protein [Bacteriophage sp.]DAW75588.1 MAG TPA: hypothetical protein [Caudoviricetes sp.]